MTFAVRQAPLALLVFPLGGDGEFRFELQRRAVRDLERHADLVRPAFAGVDRPRDFHFVQFVGLNWKAERVVVALMCWISSGMPSKLRRDRVGRPGGLQVIVNAEVSGLISILPRTIMQSHAGMVALAVFARSNGPAFAGNLERDTERGAASVPRRVSRRCRCTGR